MDDFMVQALSVSEGSDTSSGTDNGYQLVPDPESEYGYQVEEAPSTWVTMTQEEFSALMGDEPQIVNTALSGQISFLFVLTASVCLVCLLTRFLKPRLERMKWAGAILLAALFFTLFQYQWWIRLPFECYVLLPVWEIAALFAIIRLFYRKSISKQIYLAVSFQAVFEMCDVLRTYGELFIKRLHDYLGLHAAPTLPVFTYTGDPETFSFPATVVVGLDWPGCLMLLLSCVVLILSTRKLASKARRDVEGIPRSELFFLLTPAVAAIVFAVFAKVARYLLGNMVFVDWATWDSPFSSLTLYFLIPLLAVATLLCILYAYSIYQKLVVYLEEKQRAVILANQVEQMQGHIREIEQLYTGIRAMRHDMQNHLFDVKSLLAARGIDVEEPGTELAGYFTGIGTALDALNYSIYTANAVTDVVVNGKCQRAKSLHIRFDSEFRYPKGFGIDAFDISIILNNALDNALEACEKLLEQDPEAKAFIRVVSYCKQNMFLIEIENSYDGFLLDADGGTAPRTRKKDTFRHGLGFQTIIRCAEKYFGSADYTYSGQTFRLTVMLQKANTQGQIKTEDKEQKEAAVS